ncbi:MAG: hypothetical protein OXN17_13715 [Candidatus Poribacteria bacterium]|nr:hypothetical protein [Candidatus Poribacteria bacterium]
MTIKSDKQLTNDGAAMHEGKSRRLLSGWMALFARQEKEIVYLYEESPLYEGMENIFERKQTRNVRFREYSFKDTYTLHRIES